MGVSVTVHLVKSAYRKPPGLELFNLPV
jgi:hypothetical protein